MAVKPRTMVDKKNFLLFLVSIEYICSESGNQINQYEIN